MASSGAAELVEGTTGEQSGPGKLVNEPPQEDKASTSASAASPAATVVSTEQGKVTSTELLDDAAEPPTVQHKWCIFDPFTYADPPPPPKSLDDAETIPLAKAGWLSETTFWWLQPLLVRGFKRELVSTDLPKMDPSRKAGHLADVFEKHFDRRRRAIEEWNAALDKGEYVPSGWVRAKWRMKSAIGLGRKDGRREIGIAMALSDTFFWPFWSASIYKIVGDLAQTTSPLVTRKIIQEVQAAYTAHQAGQPLPSIGPGIGLSVALLVMQMITSIGTNNTFSRGGQCGVLARGALIASAYRKAMRMSGKARVQTPNAKLMSHISTSISRIDFASSFFHFSYTCIFQLIEIIVILLVVIGPTSLAGVAIVLLSLPVQTWAMKKLFRGRQVVQKHTDERIKTISELLSGIRIVKTFAWETPLLERVATSRRKELGGLRKLLAIRAAVQAMALSIPVLASVLVFAVYSLTGHTQDPAEIWTSLSLLNLLRQPLMMLPNSLSTATDAYSAMKNLVPVFTADEVPENPFDVDENADFAVKVDKASFVWESGATPDDWQEGGKGKRKGGKKEKKAVEKEKLGEEKKVEKPSELLDIELEVPRGQLLCVVGSIGSGKSSLLQGLIGEMRRTSGSVTFGSPSTGYCSQQAWIMNTTVRENILFGRPFDEQRYWECVGAACLLADFDQLPHGDLTEIGEKGIALSGGQRQRVSIARVLYTDADIVLMDDPLSAVDAHVAEHIFTKAIQGVLKEKTRILTTHAVHLLERADSVVVLENGRIVERGHFADLMASDATFSRFIREYGVSATNKTKSDAKPAAAAPGGEGKKNGGTAGKPLMQTEEQAQGTIGMRTWGAYARAANGYLTVPLVLGSLVAMSASLVLSNFSLTWWQNGTFGLDENDFIGLYSGLGIATALFTFAMGLATVMFGTTAARNLHGQAVERIVRAPISYYDTTPLGRIMNRFAKDVDSIDNRLNDAMRMGLATVSQIAASVIMIAIVYQWFLLPIAVIFVVYYYMSNFYRATARTFKRFDNTLRSSLYAWFGESLTGMSTIRAFGEQPRFLEQNERFIDLENRAYLLTVINQRWLAIRLDTMGALLTFVVAIVAVVERTSIPSSRTGLILSTVLAMQQSITMLVRQFAEVENNMASSERLVYFAKEVPQERPAQIEDTAPPSDWPAAGAISIKNVELRYRPELPAVLHDFSVEIKPNEKIGVVGRTGAGKSTLTQALFRIIELSKGSIEIDGVDISTLGLSQLRDRLAIIPQEPLLFSGTIRTNLDPFGLFDDARLYDALRRSWLVEQTAGPDGSGQLSRFKLDSVVEDEGANMSVGERSLVSLARALVKDTRIVCLDEATASVDLETDSKIQQTIASEFKDKTLLTISHRLQTIVAYDRILVLERGRVDSFAPPLELFDKEGGIFRSLCEQSSITRDDIVAAQEGRSKA
ncbi:hypothetical protein JCM8547_003948 [Rhodosporidiobolus lusitaniae]